MVSSKDVANRAGVSQSTVSRVLNEPDRVTESNLEKVRNAMKELNYRPNTIARSLVNKRTKTIALISGPIHNPFFVDTTTSIVNYANENGYKTNVFFANDEDNLSIYETVLSAQVDGMIISSIFMDDPIYEDLISLKTPYIMFNRKHNKGGDFVEIDNEKAGEVAANHLLELGHRSIGFIGGPLYASTFYGRHAGFMREMQRNKIPIDEHLIWETDTSEKGVKEAVLMMMGRKNKPTAIFASTDSIALFVIDILIELGYCIPEDISICGMDNIRISSHHSFKLTTIGLQSNTNLGRLGIEYLIDAIEGDQSSQKPVQITLDPILYQRNTTRKL
ncbi:LacI family DNA-binding transcriptional regulator [Salicibibacter cibi]|uniref:LacI family DNA-binding transcriptional regulator n=2 Tax=Salicibibacter cibi TaxID=2743001 RepID=A0A7T6ZBQ7_9BACI|nr:LacI family DNA-binding transcriptional regulator [Salicibibacter cibi]QQK80518.1 LacI family DNA-binding transcriptional regulator [Salicibibacter cibi]